MALNGGDLWIAMKYLSVHVSTFLINTHSTTFGLLAEGRDSTNDFHTVLINTLFIYSVQWCQRVYQLKCMSGNRNSTLTVWIFTKTKNCLASDDELRSLKYTLIMTSLHCIKQTSDKMLCTTIRAAFARAVRIPIRPKKKMVWLA